MTVSVTTQASADFTASANWSATPTHITAWLGSDFVGESNAISGLEILEAQEIYRIPSGTALNFTLTPSNGAVGDADTALARILNAASDEVALSFRLHSADPGANHAGSELTNANAPGYSRQSVQWTAATS